MDWYSLLLYAAPVAFAALGETVSQKAGVINIGLEGSMLMSAFFGVLATYGTGNPWIGLLAAIAAGSAMNALFGWFTVGLSTDQVVVGTAINLLAIGITKTLYRGEFGQSGQLLSVQKLPSAPFLVLLLILVAAVWFALSRSRWGLVVRSTGEYPKATEAAGFSVFRMRFGAVLIGGLFAGLAGAFLSLAIAGSFSEDMTQGRGFVAIAMVTFGRWKPQFAFAAALLIGFVESLQFKFQSFGWKLPYQLFVALPYVVALLVLVLVGQASAAPRALAETYRRDK